ncbi:hypothetical protein CHS0354_024269 [Potamilus streckersoni]|uniref:CHHC U11-48K-type domain-containing protein n=1 Tax=Potamilus streckersoni TaxID=2493646 RepID=A0AAE0SMB5_9BIVA|nr:hypothetical protein CHS0354_024269 [Potamilus streckersoni]
MSENGSMATEEEVKVREKYIESMYDFLQTCQEEVMEILNVLEWTPEHFIESKKKMVCPYDKNHVIPAKSLATHAAKCQLRQRGCTKEEIEIAISNQEFCYENAPNVVTVKLDKNRLNAVLFTHHVKNHSVFYGHNTFPATSREEEMILSREDRLAVYEHIIQQARESRASGNDWHSDPFLTANLEELAQKDNNEGKTPKSRLEELAAQRDFKRRRQSYRAKNVHITKKSYTQIIREVIENQTEIWSDILKREETSNQSDTVHTNDQSALNTAREGMDTKQDRFSGIDSDISQSQYHRHESEESGQKRQRFRDDSDDRGQRRHKERREESSERSSYSREDSQERSKRWEDHVDIPKGSKDDTSKIKREDENEREDSLKRNQSDSCGNSRRHEDRENSEDDSRHKHRSHHKKHKHKHKKHKHKSADH